MEWTSRERHGLPVPVDQVAQKLGHFRIEATSLLTDTQQLWAEATQHPVHKCRSLFHHTQGFRVCLFDGGLGPLRRLQCPADARGVGPVEQRQVQLIAHHRPLVQVRLIGL